MESGRASKIKSLNKQITVKSEKHENSSVNNKPLEDIPIIENKISTNIETVWIKPEKQNPIKNEDRNGTDSQQFIIKQEPTDSSINQTNAHRGSKFAAETFESSDVKHEYASTNMKSDTGVFSDDTDQVDIKVRVILKKGNNDEDFKELNLSKENEIDQSSTDNSYRCDVCNKYYIFSSLLKRHKLTHSGEKLHQCDECGKCFSQYVNLKVHKRVHTGEKPHTCDVCNKSFTHLSTLKNHKQRHNKEKLYQCDICSKCFTRLSCLNIHKLIHTGEKLHKCDVCDKSFLKPTTLKRHKLVHTGEKPYKCDICNKCYTRSTSLNNHKLLHTGDKLQCDICNCTFTRLADLNRHKFGHSVEQVGINQETEDTSLKHQTSEHQLNETIDSSYSKYRNDMKLDTDSTDLFNDNNQIDGQKKRDSRLSILKTKFNVLNNLIQPKQSKTLKKHKLYQSCEKPPKQDVCEKVCNLIKLKHIHTGEKPYRCDVCNKCFTSVGNLKSHKLVHFKEQLPIKQESVDDTLIYQTNAYHGDDFTTETTDSSYIKHEDVHTNVKLGTESTSSNDVTLTHIKDHFMSKQGVDAKEINEPKASKKSEREIRYKSNQSAEGVYRCDICSKYYTYLSALKRHEITHTGQKPYQCDVCGKIFSQAINLKVHKRVHTGEKPHKCDVCNKSFTHLSTLKNHKQLHSGEKLYQCDVCSKCFTRLSCLNIHKLIHTGEKLYKCDVCDKRFVNLTTLKRHKLIHTGEKPYQCDICNKCFTRSTSLNNHKILHTGEKPYQCDVCNKYFSNQNYLKTHELQHSEIKPYQCEVCNTSFTRLAHLNRHKFVHADEKPYWCDVCNKGFIQLQNLKAHKMVKHRNQKSDVGEREEREKMLGNCGH